MRAVIDTNVLISGLFWHGAPHALLEQVRGGALVLVSSPGLLAELADVMARPKLDDVLERSGISREHALAEIHRLAHLVEPPPLPQPVCRDPDDDEVLALAIVANAELIVSGDPDLLDLRSFQGIPVVSPAAALAIVRQQ